MSAPFTSCRLQTNGIQSLYKTVNSLQVQLRKLVEEHGGRFDGVEDHAI
ncbi:MAG TPA: hypothetical protein VHV32_04885 [Candidatus Angelobacter sp.]|nr:hypothetical protein [Candidatus Angelobacter sp.]